MKSAILQTIDGKWWLATERDNWIAGPKFYGPFESAKDVARRIEEWFPHIAVTSRTTPLQVLANDQRDHWASNHEYMLDQLTALFGIAPYERKKGKKPVKIDFAAYEVYCECGSTDLQLELLDLVAAENPDGPWNITCNECGEDVDCFGMFGEERGEHASSDL